MANPNLEINATEFECLVRDWILKQGGELTSLEVTHDVKVEAYDSTYQIDVLAKFNAFAGAEFIVLIECKNTVTQSSGSWFRCCTTRSDLQALIKECCSPRQGFNPAR